MKILITGGTGFIGSHLTKLLVERGDEVTVLLRSQHKRKLLPDQVQIIKGDLSIFENTQLKLPPFDVVIHLAGVIFAPNSDGYFKYNCEAVKNLTDCINRQDWKLKRFVFASSLAAAGPSAVGQTLIETDNPHPIEAYGRSKQEAEKYLATIQEFPTTSFRPAIVIGAGDENTLTLFQLAKKRLGLSINGKPQHLSFVDIDDLNQAILKMIVDTDPQHKKYFVAHPQSISNILLFKSLGAIMEKKVFIFPLPRPLLYLAMKVSTSFCHLFGIKNQLDDKQYQQLINHFVCSSEKLSKQLGWKAQYDLKQTLDKAYRGYQALGWL